MQRYLWTTHSVARVRSRPPGNIRSFSSFRGLDPHRTTTPSVRRAERFNHDPRCFSTALVGAPSDARVEEMKAERVGRRKTRRANSREHSNKKAPCVTIWGLFLTLCSLDGSKVEERFSCHSPLPMKVHKHKVHFL